MTDPFRTLHTLLPHGESIVRACVKLNQRKNKEGAWDFHVNSVEDHERWWSAELEYALYSFAVYCREDDPELTFGQMSHFEDGDLAIHVTKITTCVFLIDVFHEDEDDDETVEAESEDSGEVEAEPVKAEGCEDPK